MFEELRNKEKYGFGDLVKILEALRSPEGCPWDREQTNESLKRYLIEEAYETLEAIDAKDEALLCEELGDVLLQIVFHANIAQSFSVDDVVDGVCKKMVSRHPHVFGAVVAKTSGEVLANWEQIKRDEKGITAHSSALKRVPSNLPALMRAYKVQQKARDAGFDWDSLAPVLDKAEEELAELRAAVGQGGAGGAGGAGGTSGAGNGATAGGDIAKNIEMELGDLLFAVVNVSRFVKAHPELALTASTEKFIRRFEAMETLITGEGRSMADMGLEAMDKYWDRVKGAEF